MTKYNTKIKIAVLGAGWWANIAHIPTILNEIDAELIAIQSNNVANLNKLRQQYTDSIQVYTNDCEVIYNLAKEGKLDAVVISSVPCAHFIQAKKCLELGLHVLIEKPMTVTLEEAQTLVEISKANKTYFLLSCPWNYTSHNKYLAELMPSLIDKIQTLEIEMSNYTEILYKNQHIYEQNNLEQKSKVAKVLGEVLLLPESESYSNPNISGGGQIYCQASHIFAYISKIFNGNISSPDNIIFPDKFSAEFDYKGTDVDLEDYITCSLNNIGISIKTSGMANIDETERVFIVTALGPNGEIIFKQDLWHNKLQINNKIIEPKENESNYPFEEPVKELIRCALAAQDKNYNITAESSAKIHGLFSMHCISEAVNCAQKKALKFRFLN